MVEGSRTMTTLDKPSLDSLRGLQQQLIARLSAFRARVRRRLVLEGVAIVLAEIVGAAVLSFLLDHALRLGVWARAGMLLVILAGLAWEFWRRIIGPMRLRLG